MTKYERVHLYFRSGLWPRSRVEQALNHGWITQDQYDFIISEKSFKEEEK